jgi:hypothetical protein
VLPHGSRDMVSPHLAKEKSVIRFWKLSLCGHILLDGGYTVDVGVPPTPLQSAKSVDYAARVH